MFHFPAETFWLVVPWPIIWLTWAIIVFFKFKRDEELEDEYVNNGKGDE